MAVIVTLPEARAVCCDVWAASIATRAARPAIPVTIPAATTNASTATQSSRLRGTTSGAPPAPAISAASKTTLCLIDGAARRGCRSSSSAVMTTLRDAVLAASTCRAADRLSQLDRTRRNQNDARPAIVPVARATAPATLMLGVRRGIGSRVQHGLSDDRGEDIVWRCGHIDDELAGLGGRRAHERLTAGAPNESRPRFLRRSLGCLQRPELCR